MKFALTPDLLLDRRFAFGRIGAAPVTRTLQFGADGAIEGYRHPNETSWLIEDGDLTIRHANGSPFWRFDKIEQENGLFAMFGKRTDQHEADYDVIIVEDATAALRPSNVVVETPLRDGAQNSVCVLVRSYKCDAKFYDLLSALLKNRSGYDVAAIINETGGRPNTAMIPADVPIVWHSQSAARDIGIPHQTAAFFNAIGDVPLYFALRELPAYTHFIMIEDDVHLLRGDGTFVSYVARHLAREPDTDLFSIGLNRVPPSEHFRYKALRRVFPESYCYSVLFPFMILSRRAVAYLYGQRQLEAARGSAHEALMYCEHFVPSALKAGGFKTVDIGEVFPGACRPDWLLIGIGTDEVGYPMGADLNPSSAAIEVVHPVFEHREYLERVFRRHIFGPSPNWDKVEQALDAPRAAVIAAELKDAIRARRPAHA